MTHKDYLHQAFLLSKQANYHSIKPNPYVGALMINANGNIIGEGFHKQIGEAHAEVFAINEALLHSKDLSSTTLYVTLEPCSHFGKTPPCTNLILEHKIPKVVIAMKDPNPVVSGIEILQQNGVEVIVEELKEVKQLNQTFIINQKNKRPKYFLKSAQTIDGFIADRNGNSKWLTNNESRQYAHTHLRNRVAAILTTYKTVIKDNASFNVRLEDGSIKEQNCIVIDRNLALIKDENKALNIFYERPNTKLYLVTDKPTDIQLPNNVELITATFNKDGIDLTALSSILYSKKFYEVLVEAGGSLNAAFAKQNLVDELWMYIAPKLMNDTEAIHSFKGIYKSNMSNLKEMKLIDVLRFKDDLLLKYQWNFNL